ncbi:CRISPR system precrRNA processing endoribonuclease RAMP protein Cas6 [Methanosarcina sp.]|uniref:CRISPR system precrRNA processing endoribonuclease RAMP protein Cas6 n=1 Tax=Methanosarcina sp. TaxID=2213 RepID=UPI003BB4EB26
MPTKLLLKLKPKTEIEIPASHGCQIYAALLANIKSGNEEISKHIHDSSIGSVSISGLSGKFRKSERPNYIIITPENLYELSIGIIDPKETEIYKSLISQLIFSISEENIEIGSDRGVLEIIECKSEQGNFDQIVEKVAELDNKKVSVNIKFKTPTCIQYKNSKSYEMFPHRAAVFTSLLSKWNSVCPDKLKMDLQIDEVSRYVLEVPDSRSYQTHNVMINTIFDKNKGHFRPIFASGFVGQCSYRFSKDAPNDIRNAILILSIFAEYSGVGSAVSRGCGSVDVNVNEV